MSVLDACSHLLALHLLPYSPNSQEVMDILNRTWFTMPGPPACLYTDDDTVFKSQAWRDFCRRNGIQHLFGAAEMPEQHGLLEKVRRLMRRKLSSAWAMAAPDTPLEEVVRQMGQAYCDLARHGGISPNMMHFGRQKRPPPNFGDSLQQEPDLAPIAESLYKTRCSASLPTHELEREKP